ncbi:hypothetical protein BC628DRAFT_597656 [Trametes gibbosa]|nr:hypothetical protein BC628DRAFT_597656 [Trametes gibbosa]
MVTRAPSIALSGRSTRRAISSRAGHVWPLSKLVSLVGHFAQTRTSLPRAGRQPMSYTVPGPPAATLLDRYVRTAPVGRAQTTAAAPRPRNTHRARPRTPLAPPSPNERWERFAPPPTPRPDHRGRCRLRNVLPVRQNRPRPRSDPTLCLGRTEYMCRASPASAVRTDLSATEKCRSCRKGIPHMPNVGRCRAR